MNTDTNTAFSPNISYDEDIHTANDNQPEVKHCAGCDESLNVIHFHKLRKQNDTLQRVCKACDRQRKTDDRNTPFGRLRVIFTNSIHNAKARGIEHDLTMDDLWEMWDSQEQLCAMSGLPLLQAASPHHSYLVSLDRKDNSLGYTPENCHLICLKLNKMKGVLSMEQMNKKAMRALMGRPANDNTK